ncbi:GGDEF domain-containing protein [Klebsiella michiganensis]|uniref:GGDEF domain-containing protein n=1 Tax=Klebsiella michiganensis TaxID=1134687 RepID=UPI00156084FD|nr:GGDEF domain-containing protein [Klebsiella michiganensis]NRG22570.1 GGDEF domain-containing protein [Klebsiella michiganensis]
MPEREKNIHIQPCSSISRTHILPALLAIVAVSSLCAFVSPPLGPWREILTNPGMYIDLLALLFLLFMLWSSTKVRMNHVAVNWVRYGLLLWIAGGYKIIERINLLYVDARSQSLKDELTQLPNRRFFIDTIREKEGRRLALMIVDIDYFKKINDTWGHLVGDEVLFALGKQLAKLTSDKVLPSRIGGEEFAIIVDGLSAQEVDELAQSILQNARAILINHDNPLSISIGVGLRHKDEPQNLFIKKVDDALYKAKNNGRGRVEWAA